MQTKKIEKVLTRVSAKEPLCLSENEYRVIEQMVKEGLIKPVNEGYSLTDYGKVIEAMGYETHQKQKPVEQIKFNSTFSKSIIILTWLLAIFSVLGCVFYLST